MIDESGSWQLGARKKRLSLALQRSGARLHVTDKATGGRGRSESHPLQLRQPLL